MSYVSLKALIKILTAKKKSYKERKKPRSDEASNFQRLLREYSSGNTKVMGSNPVEAFVSELLGLCS